MQKQPVCYALRAYKSGILVAYPDREYMQVIRPERSPTTKNDYISASGVIDALENNETLKKNEKIKRNYRINRNRVRSACVDLFNSRKGAFILFLTVTMPFILADKQDAEKKAVRAWKVFLDQLRNQYNIRKYVWVKEYQCNGNVHYHILLDSTFVDIEKLQKSWNSALHNSYNIMPDFNNSVRLGEKPRVYSVKKVKNYLSKYITKQIAEEAIMFDYEGMPAYKRKQVQKQLQKDAKLAEYGIIDGVFNGKAYGYTENLELFLMLTDNNFTQFVEKFVVKKVHEDYFSIFVLSESLCFRKLKKLLTKTLFDVTTN